MEKFLLPALIVGTCFSAVVHVDTNQTGWQQSESVISPANVATGKFAKMGTFPATGYILAQPLYVPSVVISGVSHNLLIIMTLNNNVYAYDADSLSTTPLWSMTVGAPWSSHPGSTLMLGQPVGCVSTPTTDTTFLYAVCASSAPSWVLYKIALTTGAVAASVTITGQYPGTGCPAGGDTLSGGNVVFNAAVEQQRTGLVVANSKVYVAFAGFGDSDPCQHGWLFAYNTSDLSQAAVWNSTPSGIYAGIWMSAGAPAVDGSGNVYASTGDGTWDGTANFGDSILKFSPTLTLLDWFTPSDQAALTTADADLSAGRVVLIPGSTVAVVAGKDFEVWAIQTGCMGHLQGSSGCALQNFVTNGSGTPGPNTGAYGITFMNGSLFVPTTAGSIYGFTWNSGSSTFTTTPFVTQTNTYGFPGPAQMGGTSNGASNAILWVVTSSASAYQNAVAGTLRAINPATLAEYWNSDQTGTDTMGLMSKYAAPVNANGKIFVPTQSGHVTVFGVTQTVFGQGMRGAATLRGSAVMH